MGFFLLPAIGFGCGVSYLPTPTVSPDSPLAQAEYPLRTDLLVTGKTGLDGAPKQWFSKGWPPLKSARFPQRTPDTDLAEDIRKQIGKNVLDPTSNELSPAQAQQISKLLISSFGDPAEPRVSLPNWEQFEQLLNGKPNPGLPTDLKAAKALGAELKLDDDSLIRGSVIYRRLCLQCHGLTGAGDGAHAIELAAMPRDYRQGIFKFVTAFPPPGKQRQGLRLSASGKARREDLQRTVRYGLDGSMMPPFSNLPEQEISDVVSYVIHLSIRGETECATLAPVIKPDENDPDFNGPELELLFYKNLLEVLNNWGIAAKNPIPIPPERTETDEDRFVSALRGYKLYNSAEFGCAACHINYGREPALKWDLWGTIVQPRNLTLGVYRGGRRGADLYARLYGGIYPSGMTAFHNTLSTGPSFPDRPNKIWNVVHFLEALSDPTRRQQMKDPSKLIRIKERLKADGDLFLDDLSVVKIE